MTSPPGLETAIRPRSPPLDHMASIQSDATEALVIHSSPLLFGFRGELCGLSISYKLPAIGQSREMAEAGCLITMESRYLTPTSLLPS